MRKLMVVLVALAFLAGASVVYADGHEEGENDEGEYALAGDIQEVKRLLSEVLAELQKLNEAVAYSPVQDTLHSLAEKNNEALGQIVEEIRNATKASSFAGSRHIDQVFTGRVRIHRDQIPNLESIPLSHCPKSPEKAYRGIVNGRVNFPQPFSSPPEVLMALTQIGIGDIAAERGLRLTVEPAHIDEKGFNYSLYTWCNTQIAAAIASWIAVGKSDRGGEDNQ